MGTRLIPDSEVHAGGVVRIIDDATGPSGAPQQSSRGEMIPAIKLRNMSKTFDGVTVLDRVSIEIAPGEILGLVGENGSGKSTLVKILAGVHSPDAGSECELAGKPLPLPVHRPRDSGIAIIHQDLALCDEMSVAENIGITSKFDTRLLGWYRRSRQDALAREFSAEFGLPLDPKARVGTLTPAERSVVSILRALRLLRKRRSGQVIILDEPTAALPYAESERLLSILRNVAASGTAVLFISHRLHEVLDVCDRISVLRSGKLVGTVLASDTTDSKLVNIMLGYELGSFYPDRNVIPRRAAALKVDSLSGGSISDVSFEVGRGEMVGITGLAGMGQDEIPYLMFGHSRRSSGEVTVEGKVVERSVRSSLDAGIALVPANRARDSVWGAGTAAENLTISCLPSVSRYGLLRRRREIVAAGAGMKAYGVRPLLPLQLISRFSGGNQQKIVLARWLQVAPKVLLLHEPTQGVDAGAKKEVYQLIRTAAGDGTAIVIFSSDLEEIAHMCHRVLVVRHGRVAAELTEGDLSEDRLISATQGALRVVDGGD
jgi:ribose transport system ATP-binding protein